MATEAPGTLEDDVFDSCEIDLGKYSNDFAIKRGQILVLTRNISIASVH
jgi:hypothetical protein